MITTLQHLGNRQRLQTQQAACSADNRESRPPRASSEAAHRRLRLDKRNIMSAEALKPRTNRDDPARPAAAAQQHRRSPPRPALRLRARSRRSRSRGRTAAGSTRSSTPSYRPQINTTRSRLANSCASACVNGRPCADSRMTVSCLASRCSFGVTFNDATASKIGCALSTIPSPPPKGLSSTVRCRSCVKLRRSCVAISTRPVVWARLRIPYSKMLVKKSGEDRDDVKAHEKEVHFRVMLLGDDEEQ